MEPKRIGFLGTGRMATALARGFLNAGLVAAEQLLGSDVVPAAREAFASITGSRVCAGNAEVIDRSDILILAVKPNQIRDILEETRSDWGPNKLLISIAAGVSLDRLEAALPAGVRVVRVMPNTPALVGASASAYALGKAATSEDAIEVGRLMESVGLAVSVPEKLLDAVTGLSGSGPAYGFLVIEAMADGGVAAGLPRDMALRLAAQTMLGAARMILETGQHPGALKDAVCSPGGITIEGVHTLEMAGVRAAFISAVRAGARRAEALGS